MEEESQLFQKHSELEEFSRAYRQEVSDFIEAKKLQREEDAQTMLANPSSGSSPAISSLRSAMDKFIVEWWDQFGGDQSRYDQNPERGPNISKWLQEKYGTVELSAIDLTGCNLRAANFHGIKFTKVKFKDSDLEGAEFFGCNFIQVEDLSDARNFSQASFTKSIFQRCKLQNIHFNSSNHTVFNESELKGVTFSEIIDIKFNNIIVDPLFFQYLYFIVGKKDFLTNNMQVDFGKPDKFAIKFNKKKEIIISRNDKGIDMEYFVDHMPFSLFAINYIPISNKELQDIIVNAPSTTKNKKNLIGYDFSKCNIKEKLTDCDFRFSKFNTEFLKNILKGHCKVSKMTNNNKYDLRKIDLANTRLEEVDLSKFDLSETWLGGALLDKNNLLSIIKNGVRVTATGRIDLSSIHIGRKGKKIALTKDMDMSNCSFAGASLNIQNLKQLLILKKYGHAPLTSDGKINIIGAHINYDSDVKDVDQFQMSSLSTDIKTTKVWEGDIATNLKEEEQNKVEEESLKAKRKLSPVLEDNKRHKSVENLNWPQSPHTLFGSGRGNKPPALTDTVEDINKKPLILEDDKYDASSELNEENSDNDFEPR